jgi:hypothetical protein
MRAYTEIRKPALKHPSRAEVASFVDVVGFGVDYRVRPCLTWSFPRAVKCKA